ncbi:MAG: M17 family peptidase N-terminal domain-containing protein, partial [Xanthobacteraceae bacterium]
MSDAVKLGFAPFVPLAKGVLVLFCDEKLAFGPASRRMLAPTGDLVKRAAAADRFTGKKSSSLDIIAPPGLKVSRLAIVGTGKVKDLVPTDMVKLGGAAAGKIPRSAAAGTIFAELSTGPLKPEQTADIALGARLRAYAFERYKTKRKEGEERPARSKLTLAVADVTAARKAWRRRAAVAEGVVIARDLVNEPPNVLYPEEFARRATGLRKQGVRVEVLDERAMKRFGMNALLGVGQGSARGSRLVVMRWNGGKDGAAPIAFIGKGVCFDTGGISIKPAANMEDMKGDMAG